MCLFFCKFSAIFISILVPGGSNKMLPHKGQKCRER